MLQDSVEHLHHELLVASYSYDARGNRTTAASPTATRSYVYDAKNQLLGIAGVESYAYDAAGN